MNRLDFLREKFNVSPHEEYQDKLKHFGLIPPVGKSFAWIYDNFYFNSNTKEILYPEETFSKIIEADPTKNKMYVQWLMNILNQKVQLMETEGRGVANVFLEEDLPKTRENLEYFEANKRKKKFKEMAAKNFALRDVVDATDINQYHSLEELFAAVYPFKPIVDRSDLEKQMEYMVSIGEGELPVRDEYYTIFIPKTLRASELFSFTNWCTAVKGNGMFKSYTTKNLKPDGTPSDLIIVIDNGYLRNENDKIYQIHLETSQIMDKKDSSYSGLRSDIIDKNITVRNFFYDYLYNLIKDSYRCNKANGVDMFGKNSQSYVKYILQFGFGDILFEVIDDDIQTISFMDCSIDEIPDLTRFKNVGTLYFDKVNINRLDDSFFSSPNLKMIAIPRNHISKIPPSIGNCSKLKFINVKGNPLTVIPDEMRFLDPSNGGSLEKISIDVDNKDIFYRITKLLPSVEIS